MNSCTIMFPTNESTLMVSKQHHSTEGMISNISSLIVSKHHAKELIIPTKESSLIVSKHHFTEGSSSQSPQQQPLSRYESQKRRDWNTFGQYLKNQNPPVPLSLCNFNHVLEFLQYLDQFGKTKVHLLTCDFFGQPDPPAPCTCPLRQAWGSLDALIGRLRAAYEENGGCLDANPFGNGVIRVYLRDVKESQAKARGVPYKKTKKRKRNVTILYKLVGDDADQVEL